MPEQPDTAPPASVSAANEQKQPDPAPPASVSAANEQKSDDAAGESAGACGIRRQRVTVIVAVCIRCCDRHDVQ